MKIKTLPIGTTLYVVREHLYYEKGRAGPLLEYSVYAGRLREFIEGGYVQMKIELENAGANNLAYPKLNAIGKTVFLTAREAALLAKEMTEGYERRWAFTAQWGDVPLRRPWANLLTEAEMSDDDQGKDGAGWRGKEKEDNDKTV